MDEAWQHMTVLNVEVVMGTEHICGNHRRVETLMLLEIRPVRCKHSFTHNSYWDDDSVNSIQIFEFQPVINIKHSLCIGIAKVRLMRRTVMDLV